MTGSVGCFDTTTAMLPEKLRIPTAWPPVKLRPFYVLSRHFTNHRAQGFRITIEILSQIHAHQPHYREFNRGLSSLTLRGMTAATATRTKWRWFRSKRWNASIMTGRSFRWMTASNLSRWASR
jgi:hypothetical protein